jgi:zinc protease
MAGLAAQAAGGKAALASAGAGAGAGAWKAAAGAAGAAGALGGLLGTLGGLLGGWLGVWLPAEAAPTRRERLAIRRAGRRMLAAGVFLIAVLFALIEAFAGTRGYLIAWVCWMLAFWVYIAVECLCMVRQVKRIRAAADPDDSPNDTSLRSGWDAMAKRVGDRVFQSKASLFGLPMIDINLSAPVPPRAAKLSGAPSPGKWPRVARGWVAIGDDARGILLAIGSTARGFIALGGRAIGVVSAGGLAVGVVAFGGLGLGILGIGGLGAGVYALGGAAVGWRAAGGLAIGWDIACGGGAFAWHRAIGGAAIARDYALGSDAHARHANDEAARAALLDQPFERTGLAAIGERWILAQLAGAPRAEDPNPAPPPGKFTLANGLTVRIRPIQGARDVALLVLYKIGGDHDPQGRSGLAHLVEHLYVTAAAGAAPARTAQDYFQRYRAGCNAQTGDRYTVVATVFPRADLEKELTDAAARMGDLRITPADLEREKPRLLDEVANMFGQIPALGAVNNARELIRPTPLDGRKGGLPEHVRAITLDEIKARWARYYKPKNAILVLAGAIDEVAAREAVTAHFGTLEPGEEIPRPGEPGPPGAGAVRELTVKSLQPQAGPAACLAFAAPESGSPLYAPFLVLVARFWAASAQSGVGGAAGEPSLYSPLLEDPAVLGASITARPGETAAQAFARLEAFVAGTIAPPLRDDERASARQIFAFYLGTAEIPDVALGQNPYGAALSLVRREQLGIDSARLNREFDALTEAGLRRAAAEIFAPARHAGAFISPGK